MQGFRLGTRAFTSFRVWITIILWTVFYSDGAGFGALAYSNSCQWAPLYYQPVLPPDVGIGTFVANAGVIWVSGMYQSGLTVAFFLILVLIFLATRLDKYGVERFYSLPYIVVGCLTMWVLAYNHEIHQIVVTGVPECGP